MPHTDPRRVLGVRHDADLPEIRRAFRAAALAHHPDRNPGDPRAAERFRDASQAFEELLRQHGVRVRAASEPAPRAARPDANVLQIRCTVVGADLVCVLPEACAEPGSWVAVELVAASACATCGGEGGAHVPSGWMGEVFVECDRCDGVGLVKVERRVRIRFPETAARALRLRGRGMKVAERRGDVILELG